MPSATTGSIFRDFTPVGPRITEVEGKLELRSGLKHSGHLGHLNVQWSADQPAGRISHLGSRRLISDHLTVGENEHRQMRAVPAPERTVDRIREGEEGVGRPDRDDATRPRPQLLAAAAE